MKKILFILLLIPLLAIPFTITTFAQEENIEYNCLDADYFTEEDNIAVVSFTIPIEVEIVDAICVRGVGDNTEFGEPVLEDFENECYRFTGIGTREARVERIGNEDDCPNIRDIAIFTIRDPKIDSFANTSLSSENSILTAIGAILVLAGISFLGLGLAKNLKRISKS